MPRSNSACSFATASTLASASVAESMVCYIEEWRPPTVAFTLVDEFFKRGVVVHGERLSGKTGKTVTRALMDFISVMHPFQRTVQRIYTWCLRHHSDR